ncbi:hypothetical protein PCAR4_200008 [Paraburkholderia caribensis]|nr:hypothetical protein PCAR4_200008 [Paraburkholderia caribensis]
MRWPALPRRPCTESEPLVGFWANSKLNTGADIFVVSPLPKLHEFALRSYSHLPAGVPASPGFVVHPNNPYPAWPGVPQWGLLFND